MTKVRPCVDFQDPSTSKVHAKGIETFFNVANKIFGTVSRKWERRQSACSSDESVEAGIPPFQITVTTLPAYTQSSTRKLAFGSGDQSEEHKPLDDFYNNSTLTNFSKLFCAIVLLTAFFLVMTRSLQFYDGDKSANSSYLRIGDQQEIETLLNSTFS